MYNVRALDWAAMEDAAQTAAELPTAEWKMRRGAEGAECGVPPRAAGFAVVSGAHR
jgi:hypothetical protein